MTEQKSPQEKMLATIKKHENLIELAKKLNNYGKITEVIFTSISEAVSLDEKILFCYYNIQSGNKYLENGTVLPQLSSCEINILTNKNYSSFSFLQNEHLINVKQVDSIAEISIKKIFGSRYDIEEEIGAEEKNFFPTQLKASFSFNNFTGEKIASLDIDTMDEEAINTILSQLKTLAPYMGSSLSKI